MASEKYYLYWLKRNRPLPMSIEVLPPDEDGVCRVHLGRGAVLPLLKAANGRPQYAEIHVSYASGMAELRMSAQHDFPTNAPVRWDAEANCYLFATKRWQEMQWVFGLGGESTQTHVFRLTPILAGRYHLNFVTSKDKPYIPPAYVLRDGKY